jgi:hypothetical protein
MGAGHVGNKEESEIINVVKTAESLKRHRETGNLDQGVSGLKVCRKDDRNINPSGLAILNQTWHLAKKIESK